ncbi:MULTISPECIES: efflux RND transporter periplasmic adaptor subunit [Dickeya]|uniref:Efflux transporter, RND family, MFP subunit, AcrA/E family n=1 Tax=Dickeya aquatica TaxID=1401087 RepID=A0A375A6C1_9GAMM|nr:MULTISPECIES: efflux RND transporter periplasmic adaptor subunit [Dickeya]SLM61476.1 Efflux transporter, RND family, MFP subunit, AcrA/E family [Dickeya aquatica]
MYFRVPALLVNTGCALWLLGSIQMACAASQSPVQPVTVQPVEHHTGFYHTSGIVQAVRSALLSVPVSGRISMLAVVVNQAVSEGQLLARIDGTPAEQSARASQAQIAAANASLMQAKSELARAKAMLDKHYISASAFDNAQAQYRVAAAQANAQIAAAESASAQAMQFRLTAPFPGVVARVEGDLGAVALPGQPLIAFYDPSVLRVEVTLPASLVEQLQQDALAQVSVAGQVVDVSAQEWFPTTDEQSQTRKVRIMLREGQSKVRVTPGSSADVLFFSRTPGRLTLPAASVVQRTGFSAVYLAGREGRPQLRYIRTGQTLGDQIEVLAGLKPGDNVMRDPEAAASQSEGGRDER